MWSRYVLMALFGAAAILLASISFLYAVVLVVALVALATLAANLTPDLYGWVNFGPRALMVGAKSLELMSLPKPDRSPERLAVFKENSVEIESTVGGLSGTTICIRNKDGEILATLRNCRSYGPDGSRLDRAASAPAASKHIA